MYRQGLVTGQAGDYVEVEILRHSACSSCGGCALGKAESKSETIKALNRTQAQVGDLVELALADGRIARAALTAYGIPLIAMLAALLIGLRLQLSDISTLILAVVALAGSYALNKFLLEPWRTKAKKYQVVAIKIVKGEN